MSHSHFARSVTLLSSLLINTLPALAFAAVAGEIKYKPVMSSYEKLPAAKKGGIFYDDLGNNPKAINPMLDHDSVSRKIVGYLWMPLFWEDTDNLNFLPALAESYTISADKKSYTYVLRDSAAWEDGTPLTTDDVQFSYDTLMNPKTDAAPARAYYEGVKLIVNDKHSFTFTVPAPKFDTLRSLNFFSIVNKKQFEHEPDFNKSKGIMQPIGNGPYKLTLFQRDQRIEIERVKNWWGAALPQFKNVFNFDKIVFRVVTDPNLLYERFLKGDVDLMDFIGPGLEIFKQKVRGIDKDKIGESSKDNKPLWAAEFKNKAPRGYQYLGWNLRLPMFKSKKTRQALAHLVDVQSIIEKVFYGYHYQSTSPFGSLTMNSAPELRLPGKMITYDLKKALQLLKEDGWADSDHDNILDKVVDGKKVDFKFTLKYNSNNPARGKIAQIIKENFKSAGIEVTIRSMEWNAFLDDVNHRDFDAILLAWGATPYPNPKQTWFSGAEANQGSNSGGYNNPKVDALIDKANLEMNLAKRAKILQEINRILYDDQPYIFLTEPRSLVAGFNKKLKASVWAMQYDVEPAPELYQAE